MSNSSRRRLSSACRMAAVNSLALLAAITAGCGGGSSSTQNFSGNTQVTVVATSTANDQLSQFELDVKTFTLTTQSGKSLSLLPAPEQIEFMHVNGTAEPLFTVGVPQDTYVSATATIGPAVYACESGNSAGTVTAGSLVYGYTPDSHVTVNVPAPIEVSGSNMVLALNLLVSESASWGSSVCADLINGAITPTFNFGPAPSPLHTTMRELVGLAASANASGNSLTVTGADASSWGVNADGSIQPYVAPSWIVSTNGATAFQGISGLSAITAGMPVEIDATLQPDGSLAASRIAVTDADTNNQTVFIGPALVVRSDRPVVTTKETLADGFLPTHLDAVNFDPTDFDFENALFHISGALSNLQQLPFTAQFGPATLVDGQNVSITTHQTTPPDVNLGYAGTTVTLVPQTINGTVTAVSSEGNFETYTVSLASYDLFPQLAVQTYQKTLLTSPGTVIVYADSSATRLNTRPIAVGSVVRFNGVVFNDGGTLRMDCLQINDGVAE